MNEQEAISILEVLKDWVGDVSLTRKDCQKSIDIAIKSLEIKMENTNNDWIPCDNKHKLPTVTNTYLVTKMCENDGNPIYETCHEIFYTKDNKWDCERDEYNEWKVIAWREKLKPYIPEEE